MLEEIATICAVTSILFFIAFVVSLKKSTSRKPLYTAISLLIVALGLFVVNSLDRESKVSTLVNSQKDTVIQILNMDNLTSEEKVQNINLAFNSKNIKVSSISVNSEIADMKFKFNEGLFFPYKHYNLDISMSSEDRQKINNYAQQVIQSRLQ